MYYDRFFPFYVAYANPALYDGERIQEQEFALMKSYYPEAAGRIQEKVEEECQLLDYEGSRLYDEYPDKFMLHQLCRQIRTQVEGETAGKIRAISVPGVFSAPSQKELSINFLASSGFNRSALMISSRSFSARKSPADDAEDAGTMVYIDRKNLQ